MKRLLILVLTLMCSAALAATTPPCDSLGLPAVTFDEANGEFELDRQTQHGNLLICGSAGGQATYQHARFYAHLASEPGEVWRIEAHWGLDWFDGIIVMEIDYGAYGIANVMMEYNDAIPDEEWADFVLLNSTVTDCAGLHGEDLYLAMQEKFSMDVLLLDNPEIGTPYQRWLWLQSYDVLYEMLHALPSLDHECWDNEGYSSGFTDCTGGGGSGCMTCHQCCGAELETTETGCYEDYNDLPGVGGWVPWASKEWFETRVIYGAPTSEDHGVVRAQNCYTRAAKQFDRCDMSCDLNVCGVPLP